MLINYLPIIFIAIIFPILFFSINYNYKIYIIFIIIYIMWLRWLYNLNESVRKSIRKEINYRYKKFDFYFIPLYDWFFREFKWFQRDLWNYIIPNRIEWYTHKKLKENLLYSFELKYLNDLWIISMNYCWEHFIETIIVNNQNPWIDYQVPIIRWKTGWLSFFININILWEIKFFFWYKDDLLKNKVENKNIINILTWNIIDIWYEDYIPFNKFDELVQNRIKRIQELRKNKEKFQNIPKIDEKINPPESSLIGWNTDHYYNKYYMFQCKEFN